MAAGAVVTSAVGVGVALITVRLRGDYLAIVTLGFAETIRIVASNAIWLTNGTDGISGIAGPYRSRLSPEAFNLTYLGIVVAIVAVAYVFAERLRASPFGRVLRAIRDDEQVAAVAGKHVALFKVKAFAMGAAALGLAGALYAHYTSYIAPDIFVPLLTLYIKLALLAGGLGNNRGAIVGAFAVVFLLESTRFVIPLVPGVSAVQECRVARAPDRDAVDSHVALSPARPHPGAVAAHSRAVIHGYRRVRLGLPANRVARARSGRRRPRSRLAPDLFVARTPHRHARRTRANPRSRGRVRRRPCADRLRHATFHMQHAWRA